MGLSGLEPPTLRLSVARSSQLSYRPLCTFPHVSLTVCAPVLRRLMRAAVPRVRLFCCPPRQERVPTLTRFTPLVNKNFSIFQNTSFCTKKSSYTAHLFSIISIAVSRTQRQSYLPHRISPSPVKEGGGPYLYGKSSHPQVQHFKLVGENTVQDGSAMSGVPPTIVS